MDVAQHLQPLPVGGQVVLGPTNPEQAEGAVRSLAHRLPGAIRSFGLGVIDCGRWAPGSPAGAALAGCDVSVVVVRPDLVGIEHLRSRLDALRHMAGGELLIVAVGERPYAADAVRGATGCKVVTVAVDPAGVEGIHGGRRTAFARRSPLARSARSLLDRVLTPDPVPA